MTEHNRTIHCEHKFYSLLEGKYSVESLLYSYICIYHIINKAGIMTIND